MQFDQVLTALQCDTREDLKRLLEGYGTALTYEPTAADDVGQDPDVKGETAARSLNDSLDYAPGALEERAIVNQAFLGLEPHDLSGLVDNTGKVTKALARNEESLKGFVTNFNTTLGALAAEQADLKRSIALLGPTLEHADSALTHLNASFPNTRAFAREILPGVRETPATIDAAEPWIAQARKLVSPAELGGLTKELRPTTADLAKLVDGVAHGAAAGRPGVAVRDAHDPADRRRQDPDGQFTSNEENYKEFWYAMVGLAGESQNFDGNGHYVRFAVGGGSRRSRPASTAAAAGEKLYGRVNDAAAGHAPRLSGQALAVQPHGEVQGPEAARPQRRQDRPAPTAAGRRRRGAGRDAPSVATPAGHGAVDRDDAAASSSSRQSLTEQLVDRLNPFRKGTGR